MPGAGRGGWGRPSRFSGSSPSSISTTPCENLRGPWSRPGYSRTSMIRLEARRGGEAMPTVISNFTFYRGEDIAVKDTVYQADGITPQDLTGWSVQFLLRPQDIPGLVTLRKTTGGGG